MKRPLRSRLTAFSVLSLLPLCWNLHAAFIQPVAVQVSNGEETQDTLINGLGLDDFGVGSPAALHVRDASEMWSVVGSIRADAVFDLGQTVDLTRVYLWNYNVIDGTDIGMREVEVLVAPDANPTNQNFTAIAVITLQEGGDAAQVFDVVGTTVRRVKLRGLSNWGHGWSVGLAEVRFESGDIAGEVPRVVIANPHDGDVIPAGTAVFLDARVTDPDADLQKVEYFNGTTKFLEKTALPYTLTLTNLAQGDHAIRVVATDQSGKVGWSTVNFTVRELVADRIEQIDDTADEGDGLNQITYTGTWNLAQGNPNDPRFLNNDHYSDVRNAYFEVRFKGVKIDVFATVASHHGSGVATIDGGTEYTVNYRATQRSEQVQVWSSPILQNREHVLRIRVAGNGVVTADRFDVHVSDQPEVNLASITRVTATPARLVVEVEDAPASILDPATVALFVDGAPAAAQPVKSGATTTITHDPASPFLPGSEHLVRLEARDFAGTNIVAEMPFALAEPWFPLTGMGGPAGTAGNWGVRQIWNAGRADALVSAVNIALSANQPGFTGQVHNTSAPYINFAKTANPGPGGLIPDDLPLPAESQGLSDNDFVIVARARVNIPRAGDWTIGVHSDEGFALRFIGAPFVSVSGAGVRDDNFPEYMGNPVNTPDSNTRGLLQGIPAGVYEIEFISWERVGSAYYEIYAAEGAFVDDFDTDQWRLIGEPGGLEIVAAPATLTIQAVNRAGNQVTLDFTASAPGGQYQVLETGDFASWQPVAGAAFQTTATGVRATLDNVTAPVRFYRVAQNATGQ